MKINLEIKEKLYLKYGRNYIDNFDEIKMQKLSGDFLEISKFLKISTLGTLKKIQESMELGIFNDRDKYFIFKDDVIYSININEYKMFLNEAFEIINNGIILEKINIKTEKEELTFKFLQKKMQEVEAEIEIETEENIQKNYTDENTYEDEDEDEEYSEDDDTLEYNNYNDNYNNNNNYNNNK